MIYLASPYSSPIPDLEHQRFLAAEKFVAEQFRSGCWVFSPILYAHMMAKKHALPKDAKGWLAFNIHFLRMSEAVFVLQLPRWEESEGVQIEIKVARAIMLPVVYFDRDGNQVLGQAF